MDKQTKSDAVHIVEAFWARMATNDFAHAAALLTQDYVLDWPQTRERIRGPARFTAVNSEYPANGPWRFTVNRIVGDDREAVSDVSITDGVQTARALTFTTIRDGKIAHQTEYWPEPYAPPENRQHLVESMDEQ